MRSYLRHDPRNELTREMMKHTIRRVSTMRELPIDLSVSHLELLSPAAKRYAAQGLLVLSNTKRRKLGLPLKKRTPKAVRSRPDDDVHNERD